MPIDPNIALQVKPLQLNDPLAQYAQASQIQNYQNQNALAQYQLGAAQRAEKTQNVLSEAWKQGLKPDGTIDPAKVRNAMAAGGVGHLIPAFEKDIAATEQSKSTTGYNRARTETETSKLTKDKIVQSIKEISSLDTPEEVIASIDRHLANKDIDEQKANTLKATLKPFTTPGPNGEPPPRFVEWQRKTLGGLLDAKDKLALETPKIREIVAADGSKTYVDENKNSPTFGQPMLPPQAAGMTPYQRGTLGVSQGQLGVAQNRLALEKENQRRAADPVFQQSMAQARVTGEAMAKDKVLRATQLPKVLDTAEMTINEIDAMIGKRDAKGNLVKGAAPHPGFSSTVGATLLPGARFVPGADEADFQTRFDQVKGGAFLQAFETLKGGGSITNIEGEKGTAALNRMSLAQSEKEFITAAIEFKGIVRKGVERAKKLAGGSDTPAAPTAGGSAADPLGIRP